MSDITEEDVMKYCYSRNLMLVTKESLEYMHRPIVVETINKDAIPVEWMKYHVMCRKDLTFDKLELVWSIIKDWEKENE